MKLTLILALLSVVVLPSFVESNDDDLQASMERGKTVYSNLCIACHMAEGQGMAGVFPPLAESDYLMADKARSIKIALVGLQGPVTVNGVTYQGAMPATGLSDQEVADVLNYVRNSWGNKGEIVKLEEVKKVREGTK
ncbi:nitrite reductase (NO-forming) [Catalinimonas alkaloidigena]|uniref:Nitrite reductase (NO-forming) n=1 Tax=Catalinimonas alkaloidigena TaxID=1075417 RepID=A0A1G9BBA9_9BACT|nr:cytochrome c [Catalinimonas alkaloidigena]SDK36761.1 nitrite reductase (NO-forming) [Catalinimonas alkaloidigena]